MSDKVQENAESGGVNPVADLLRRESVLVGIATLSAYLFKFFYERAYFIAFGIDASFVEVNVEGVILSLGGLIIALFVIYNLLLIVPVGIGGFLYYNWPVIFVSYWALRAYLSAGWSVWFVTLLIVIVFLLVIYYWGFWREGWSFRERVERDVSAELKIRQKFVVTKAFDGLDDRLRSLVFFVVLAPLLLGTIVGSGHALTKSVFLSIEKDGMTYLLISKRSGGGLYVSDSFVGGELEGSVDVMFLNQGDLAGLPHSVRRIQRSVSLGSDRDRRKSFRYFLFEVSVLFREIERTNSPHP